ncbi:MAG: DegT/DnrJ/EryC1/StrS family aminotransferase [Caldilineaceae bacterium]
MMTIPFGDLRRQNAALRTEIDEAIGRVLDSGWFILGQEVAAFEQEFAAYCGASHCVGVASGFDALYLALASLDIGLGDEVITVANACMYEAAAILQTGAAPIFADVDPITHNMAPAALAAAITPRTKAILPVHLFGRLAPMLEIDQIAQRHGIPIIEDAAQAHGAWRLDEAGAPRRAGAWGKLACFSFYPSKNLGALGDGGAVVTNDAGLAERLRRLRMYGWSSKYCTAETNGRNSRLDEMQAAILRVKLRHLEAGNRSRRERAAWYAEALADLSITLPTDEEGHIYHLYVIEAARRDEVRSHLVSAGIGCDVHYPIPTHLQPAYQSLNVGPGALPVTERLAGRILSLPMWPELTRDEVHQVADAVSAALRM